MKMAIISRVIGKNAKQFMALALVSVSLLGNNTTAAGEQKSDKPAVRHKTVIQVKTVSHEKNTPEQKKVLFVAPPGSVSVKTSFYGGPSWNGNDVACAKYLKKHGQRHLMKFNDKQHTAASNSLPCGTVISLTNPKTGKTVSDVRITDTGGFKKYNRGLDVAKSVAIELGMIDDGVVHLSMVVNKKG